MNVSTMVTKKYDVNIIMSSEELDQLLNEIEALFVRYAKEGTLEEIEQLTELKDLLVLSINNL